MTRKGAIAYEQLAFSMSPLALGWICGRKCTNSPVAPSALTSVKLLKFVPRTRKTWLADSQDHPLMLWTTIVAATCLRDILWLVLECNQGFSNQVTGMFTPEPRHLIILSVLQRRRR